MHLLFAHCTITNVLCDGNIDCATQDSISKRIYSYLFNKPMNRLKTQCITVKLPCRCSSEI